MNKHKLINFLTLLIILLPQHSEVFAKNNQKGFVVEQINWDSAQNEVTEVYINNLYGDLRILESNSNQLKLRSVVQRLYSKSKPVELSTTHTAGKLQIDFKVNNIDNDTANELFRIDTVVFLPKNTKLKASIEKGKLMTKSISNDLTVNSFSSDFEVNSSGLLNLSSQKGSIALKLKPNQSTGSTISTSQSIITLFFDHSSIDFNIKTNGYITTNDATLLESKSGKTPQFNLSKENGELMFNLISDTGNVQLINTKKQEEG